MVQPYAAPDLDLDAFNCPHCGAFAHQKWLQGHGKSVDGRFLPIPHLKISICTHCDMYCLWHQRVMIHPDIAGIAPPNDDLPGEIKDDYLEAAGIMSKSPRGAAALLRLCIQKLVKVLGEEGKDLNNDIKNLVKKGLLPQVQQSLDVVRVIGNEAVHPGLIDLKDDPETASTLFRLINIIAEQMISAPKQAEALYESLPESKKEQIERRNGVRSDSED